ncbi:MAG: efflux RND transporter periplasmic adaptor subunit [Gammaproteobacteria bacterium]|nr:efflux RND transporter periplasmic adaptor subunit [Gammaproteobacteria bacterium]
MPSTPRRAPSAALLLALALLVACQKPEPPAAAAPGGAPPVTVAATITREVLDSDEFPGRIEATQAVRVRARVNGYVERVAFTPGSEVAAGDLLYELDARPFKARVAEAEAALAATEAQLALARTESKRQAQMLETQATSRREYDAAAAAVKNLEAARGANRATLARARLDLGYTRVTAPIAGRVGKDEITVGNLVQGENADSPVLTTLVSIDPVYVSFEADERAYLKYIAGARGAPLKVAVGLADEQGFPHAARLNFVDNNIESASGTVRLRATLSNAERRFTPGLFARVRLEAATGAREVVMVADRAIGTDQSKRYVLVVGADKVANYREVRIGRQVGGLRVIEDGLQAGESIVVNGLQRVRPGSPVTPSSVPMEKADQAATPSPQPPAS